MRADVGQVGFEDLIDLVGRRRGTMTVSAMLVAGFAAGAFGVGLGSFLAEGSGLALAGPQGIFEPAGQFQDLGFELGHPLLENPTTGTGRLVHADVIVTPAASSCASPGGANQLPLAHLLRYLPLASFFSRANILMV